MFPNELKLYLSVDASPNIGSLSVRAQALFLDACLQGALHSYDWDKQETIAISRLISAAWKFTSGKPPGAGEFETMTFHPDENGVMDAWHRTACQRRQARLGKIAAILSWFGARSTEAHGEISYFRDAPDGFPITNIFWNVPEEIQPFGNPIFLCEYLQCIRETERVSASLPNAQDMMRRFFSLAE